MATSMEDYLKVITPQIPTQLVSSIALSRIQTLAHLLPPFSLAGFESRLNAAQSTVDLLVRFPCLVPNFSPQLLTHSSWQSLQSFCQEWVQPHSPLHDSVQHIWLEFDLDRSPLPVPIPCLFLSLNPTVTLEATELMQVAHQIPHNPLSSTIAAKIRHCIDALPAGARVGHLGAMLSRPGQAVRLVVMGLHPQDIPNYLGRIGWQDPSHCLEPLVTFLADQVDSINVLDIDVGETIFPKIGLECFFKQQPNHEPRWQAFLDALVAQGLCTSAKHQALLNWPGYSQRLTERDMWPDNLSWGDRFLGTQGYSIFWRELSHIKISYQPFQPLEAKGYLAFGHNWFEASAVKQRKAASSSFS